MLYNQSKRTITPENRKKLFAHRHLRADANHPIPSKPGAVPNAKNKSVSAQMRALPVLIAYICTASVNPQGRKKVRAQAIMIPIRPEADSKTVTSTNDFGKVGRSVEVLGDMPVKRIPSKSIMIPESNVTPPRYTFDI